MEFHSHPCQCGDVVWIDEISSEVIHGNVVFGKVGSLVSTLVSWADGDGGKSDLGCTVSKTNKYLYQNELDFTFVIIYFICYFVNIFYTVH